MLALIIIIIAYIILLYFGIIRIILFAKLREKYNYQCLPNDTCIKDSNYYESFKSIILAKDFTSNVPFYIEIGMTHIKIKKTISNIEWLLPIEMIYKVEEFKPPMFHGTIIWQKKINIPSPFFILNREFKLSNSILKEQ